ncbi:MAG: hypothetical protein CK426_08710 [Legionella sp.]|nr:MAG: hypothetical protein CK423_07285 [Legionella sp.]PJD97142.1 MAG: hypothetical protein CK426_08710 [Legionella sp.]
MKKILCLVLTLLCTGLSYSNDKIYNSMVFFGDSLSDNGNLYQYLWHTLPSSPPYYEGHFSNGPVWTEQLYSTLFPKDDNKGFKNYAVGGAGALLSYKQVLPYTLKIEIDNYLFWHAYAPKNDTLFILWIGGNNYLNGPANIEEITDSVVQAIANAIERLIKAGGNKFLIPNLPDLGKTPFATSEGEPLLLSLLVNVHNKKLADKINELQANYPETTLIYFDVHTFFNHALENPEQFGFSITKEPCYLGGYLGWLTKVNDQDLQRYFNKLYPNFSPDHWSFIANNPQLKEALSASYTYQLLPQKNKDEALQCDKHLFWDKIHPTSNAHTVIAEQARLLLNESGLIAQPAEDPLQTKAPY